MQSSRTEQPERRRRPSGSLSDVPLPLRILLVEDNDDDAFLIERRLSQDLKHELSITRAISISELQAALDSAWDLVLCDYSLPTYSAPDAIRLIRQRQSDLPIIVVSGAIGEEEAVSLIRSGAQDFIMKSNLSRLRPAIEQCLRQMAAHRFTRRAEKAFANIVEHSYQALFVVQDGRIVFANRAAAELTGHSAVEIMSMTSDEVLDLVKGPDRNLVKKKTVSLISKKVLHDCFTCRIPSETEGTRILEVYASGIEFDGRPAAHFAAIDITDRMHLEDALLRGKQEWERTFDAVRELIVITDQNNRIIRLNRAVAARLNTLEREIVGLQWEDVSGIPPERWFMNRAAGSAVQDMEAVSEPLGGRFHFSSTPRLDRDGELLGAIHVGRDVTAQRQTEEILRRQLAVDETDRIFRTFRHELGNALNTLKTTLAVFRRNVEVFDREKRETYLERCLGALGLAEKLLYTVRIYQTLDEVRLQPMDLAEFLRAQSGLIFEHAQSRGIACRLVARDQEIPVMADRDALLRVLLNLVDNAASACAGVDDPVIEIECNPNQGDAVTSVRDNGCGIPFEDRDLVFSPFVTTKDDGSGMGLAIVQKLMVRMNGMARVEPAPLTGTAIELRLPMDGTEEGQNVIQSVRPLSQT